MTAAQNVDRLAGGPRVPFWDKLMSRKSSPWLALLAAAFFVAASEAIVGQTASRPNILIILIDDFGYGDLSIHGCKDIPTPKIDALAADSVRCSQGYISAPQCSPTRAGLMTGRYQQRFGHEFNAAIPESSLALTETTLATRLRAAG